jgi:autotransporter-associated beta strand protein
MQNQTHPTTRLPACLGISIALAILASGASRVAVAATDGTWATTSGGNWSDAGNWNNGNIASGADATATFNTAIAGATSITIDSGRTIGHLVLDSAQQWNFTGQWLTLAVSDPQSGGPTITTTRGYQFFATGIAGTQGFIKLGGGSLYLAGSGNYSGTTHIDAGHVYLRSGTALGATGAGNGTVVNRTATAAPQLHFLNNLTTSEDVTLRYTTAITDTSSVTLKNDSGANTLNGALTLERAGSTADAYHFRVEVTQGTLNLTGNISGKLADGATAGQTGAIANSLRIITSTQATLTNANITGVISDGTIGAGGLSLYKAGSGILRLSAANIFSGSTEHNGGLLLINNSAGSGTGMGSVSVINGYDPAILGGTGTIAPAGTAGVSIASGATVAPGDTDATGASTTAGQTLTIDLASTTGHATFATGALLAIDLNPETAALDTLAFTGLSSTDTDGGARVHFNNNVINFTSIAGATGVLADGIYTLVSFDAANAYTGQLVPGAGLEAYAATLLYNADSIQLRIGNAIPEPATLAILASFVGLGAALASRCRKHQR